MTPDEWLNSPGVADHPGLAPFEKDCGTCHVVDGLTEGGMRDAPKLFAWGSPQWIARMIRKPGASDLYGYLEEKDQMPAFTRDQLTENDVTTVIRFLKNDYLGARRPRKPRSRLRSSRLPILEWALLTEGRWQSVFPRPETPRLSSAIHTSAIPHLPAGIRTLPSPSLLSPTGDSRKRDPRSNRVVGFSKKWAAAIPRRPHYGTHDHSYY